MNQLVHLMISIISVIESGWPLVVNGFGSPWDWLHPMVNGGVLR